MKTVVIGCVAICMIANSQKAIAQDLGNGTIINVAKSPVTLILRKKGEIDEVTTLLGPNETVRLRKHQQYELFIPAQQTVYDLDASIVGGARNPWSQHFYSVFKTANGEWKLGKGLVGRIRSAAARHINSVENELSGKWDLAISDTKTRNVDSAQLRFCQAFMLEAFLRNKFGLRTRIHPDPWRTGQDPDNPGDLVIEALSCQPVPNQNRQALIRLIKEALNSPNANVTFETTCDSIDDSVWNAFVELCSDVSGQTSPPKRDTRLHEGTRETLDNLYTGVYDGIDGTGTGLDIASQEYNRMRRIGSEPGFSVLAGAESAIRKDIRVLVELSTVTGPQAERRRMLMMARIKAHYGCSFLYVANPKDVRHAVTIDNRPVLTVFVRNADGTIERKQITVTYTVQHITLTNLGISVAEGFTAKFRPRGYCRLIQATLDPVAKAALIRKYDSRWSDLPRGDEVGHHFEPSDKHCIKVADGGEEKIFDFVPISGQHYFIGKDGPIGKNR